MKKAILAVSFGTRYAEAEQKCIRPVEQALERAFPDREVRRAYTSPTIRRLLAREGCDVPGEAEALEALEREGYGDVVVAPTHIIPGQEYVRVLETARGCPVSEPLLAAEEDLDWMARLLEQIAQEEGRPLLMMGHGTEHAADSTYARLREKLAENVFLACVEGAHTLEALMPRLEKMDVRRIALMPLMLVAGDHARNDLAGDAPDSWKSQLEARGFDVRVRMQGLGELDAVRTRFVEKALRVAAR